MQPPGFHCAIGYDVPCTLVQEGYQSPEGRIEGLGKQRKLTPFFHCAPSCNGISIPVHRATFLESTHRLLLVSRYYLCADKIRMECRPRTRPTRGWQWNKQMHTMRIYIHSNIILPLPCPSSPSQGSRSRQCFCIVRLSSPCLLALPLSNVVCLHVASPSSVAEHSKSDSLCSYISYLRPRHLLVKCWVSCWPKN
jgi:hypothetical protein